MYTSLLKLLTDPSHLLETFLIASVFGEFYIFNSWKFLHINQLENRLLRKWLSVLNFV